MSDERDEYWWRPDDQSPPEPMDVSEGRKAKSSKEVENTHKSPEVKLKDNTEEQEFEDEQTRSWWTELRFTIEAWAIRLRNVVSTAIQLFGFYLIFASLFQLFGPTLTSAGIPVDAIPSVVYEPYYQIGIAPLFVFVIGMGVVWVSTSRHFI